MAKTDKPFSLPISLRWDTDEGGAAPGVAKIKFPVTEGDGQESLSKLIKDCQPAVFGLKGENVLDETYRKAAKMDSSRFSSDFCPYSREIVDTIAQVLLPTVSGAVGTKGVRAELYKLNACEFLPGLMAAFCLTIRTRCTRHPLVSSRHTSTLPVPSRSLDHSSSAFLALTKVES